MDFGQDFFVDDLPQSSQSYDPLPAGWYVVQIEAADIKTTKAGTGQYMSVQYKVLDGPHAGRSVFGNVNIRNPNPKAEEIGRQQLGDIMRAIGLKQARNTEQLLGGVLQIKVAVRKDEQYGDGNDVKAFKAHGAKPVATSPSAPQAAAKPAGTPPWIKK